MANKTSAPDPMHSTVIDRAVTPTLPLHQPHAFFQEGYVKLRKATALLSALLLLSVIGNVVQMAFGVRYRDVAVDPDGQITEIGGYKEPLWTDEQILLEASTAVAAATTYSFDTYATDFKDAAAHFDKKGWAAYSKGLTTSSIPMADGGKVSPLQSVVDGRIRVTGIPYHPTIVSRGHDNSGLEYWIVDVPVSVSFTSLSENRVYSKLAVVRMLRQPLDTNVRGVAVDSMSISDSTP